MVNLVHLRTLLVIIQLGSFTAAASRLGYTASAVSQQMSALERDTGVQLFERSARSVRPTEAAKIMAHHAVKVLADIDTLLAATAEAHSVIAEELRVGVFPSLATPLLSKLLPRDAWQERDINLKVSVAEPSYTIQRLRSAGELNVAFIYQVGRSGLGGSRSGNRHWMGDDEFRLVVPASWNFEPGATVPAEQLDDTPWIFHHPGTSIAAVIERLFMSCSVRPRVIAYSDDYRVALDMVATGYAGAFIPQLALQVVPDGVVMIDVPEVRLARNIFALVIQDERTPAVEFFLEQTAEILKEFGISPHGN